MTSLYELNIHWFLKLLKWFSQEQWVIFSLYCCLININDIDGSRFISRILARSEKYVRTASGKSLTDKALKKKHANNELLSWQRTAMSRDKHNSTAVLLNVMWMYIALYSMLGWGHQNCNCQNMHCSTIQRYFFKSRLWRLFNRSQSKIVISYIPRMWTWTMHWLWIGWRQIWTRAFGCKKGTGFKWTKWLEYTANITRENSLSIHWNIQLWNFE